MKPKQLMLFAVAIGCGLVAMIGAQTVLSGNKIPEQEMVDVLVALKDFDAGVPLDESTVGVKKVAKELVQDGAITRKEEWVDRCLKIPATTNMPILQQYLAPKGSIGITSQIPEGMLVQSVQVDSTQLHSGLLKPGTFVKITCVIQTQSQGPNRGPITQTKTVLDPVEVITVGNVIRGTEEAKKDANSPKVENIGLLVYPQQQKVLELAIAISKKINIAILPAGKYSRDTTKDLDENDFAKRVGDLNGEVQKVAEVSRPSERSHERPKGSSFSGYLDESAATSGVADLGKAPASPGWRIKIWNGDKPMIQEVPLPNPPASASLNAPSKGPSWTAPIMNFFSKKRQGQPSVKETQSTSSEDEQPDLSHEKSAAAPAETVLQ